MKNTIITILLIFFLSPAFAQKDSGKIKRTGYISVNEGLLINPVAQNYSNTPYGYASATPLPESSLPIVGNNLSINLHVAIPKSIFAFDASASYETWANGGMFNQFNLMAGPTITFRIFNKILVDLKLMGGISYCVAPSIMSQGSVTFDSTNWGGQVRDQIMESYYTKSLTATAFTIDAGIDFRFYIYKRICNMKKFSVSLKKIIV